MSSEHALQPPDRHLDVAESGPSRSAGPPSQPLALTLVDDPFQREAHHVEQDEKILAQADNAGLTPPEVAQHPARATTLLRFVMEKCAPLFKPQYAEFPNAAELCRDNEQLRSELSRALERRSFARIRRLAILRAAPAPAPVEVEESAIRHESAHTISRAWDIEYQGDLHKSLYQSISIMSRESCNTASIVQSSGTGKSRMVDEQAKLVFTIPFNLRDELETKQSLAWPLPDVWTLSHLTTSIPEAVETYYFDFFKFLFQRVTMDLRARLKTPKETYGEVATWWREYLLKKDHRAQLYESVRRSHYALVLKASVRNPEETTDTVKLVLYFDEAHTLSIIRGARRKVLYEVLCSVLDILCSQCPAIFALFLSTNISLTRFAPMPIMAASGPAQPNWLRPLMSLTGAPFDCSHAFPIQWSELKYHDLCSLNFIAQFGRPLSDAPSKIFAAILPLARAKLICSSDIQQSGPERFLDTENARRGRLAVADVRLCLEYAQTAAATREQATLVAFAVDPQGEHLRSRCGTTGGTPARRALPHILVENVKNGVLDLGARGEVVARALLTQAHDRAAERENSCTGLVLYCQGCSLAALFSKDYAELVMESPACNVHAGVPLRAAFRGARVRFTHLDRLADDGCLNTHAMLAAFVRGVAFVCPSGVAPMVDVVVPVLLDREALAGRSMTALLVQVKRRDVRGQRNKLDVEAHRLGFFASGDDEHAARPVVTLVMELGVQGAAPREAAPAAAPAKKDKKGKRRAPRRLAGLFRAVVLVLGKRSKKPCPAQVVVHPRYNFFAHGCSERVYKVIDADDVDAYRYLLSDWDFLRRHPRQSQAALDDVRKMKPFWTWSSSSWAWAWPDLPPVRSNNDGGLGEEGVVCCVDGDGDEDFVVTDEY
ncbi:hypothetical protein B0H21DRAFT_823927 [Amylocystis lapponica]|nr:hypothetical protein B0H21DRAFT_823927 [Amylocystis lapponica]